MKKTTLYLITGLLLAGTAKALAESTPATTVPKPVSINSIKAYPFYNFTGKIGTINLIDNPKLSLWNSITGDGSIGGASNDTMAVVDISGPAMQYAPKKIQITALVQGKTLVQRTFSTSVFDAQGRYYIPLLINDTGCQPLTITAQLVDAKQKISKTIPFACGE